LNLLAEVNFSHMLF